MQTIRIVSRKYDGRLRDDYEAFLYAEDAERLVVYAPVGTLSYDRRKQTWVAAPDGLLEIYFKARWYNVWHICEQTSNMNQMYSNLFRAGRALPTNQSHGRNAPGRNRGAAPQ